MTTQLALKMLAALAVAAVVSFLTTPMVKSLAYKVGAIDVPKDNRRMHKTPIPPSRRTCHFHRVPADRSDLRRH